MVKLSLTTLRRGWKAVRTRLSDISKMRFSAILRDIQQLVRLMPGLIDPACYLGAGPEEVAEDGLLLENLRVVDHVGGGGDLPGQGGEVGVAPHALEVIGPREVLAHGHQVDGLALVEEVEHGAEDLPVAFPVKVFLGDDVDGLEEGVALQENGAQDGLLRFQVLRRKFTYISFSTHSATTSTLMAALTSGATLTWTL
jgi:hypothetical protein